MEAHRLGMLGIYDLVQYNWEMGFLWVIDEMKIGGGLAEVKHHTPVEVQPTQVGLKNGTISGTDAVAKCSHEHGAIAFHNDPWHRYTRVTEHFRGWVGR